MDFLMRPRNFLSKWQRGDINDLNNDNATDIARRCTGLKEPVACTMDARQCSDGSYVGRTGPNCEFICP